MMDEWFDQYVYKVVVKKEYLSSELLKIRDTEPVVVPFWDPTGTLARN